MVGFRTTYHTIVQLLPFFADSNVDLQQRLASSTACRAIRSSSRSQYIVASAAQHNQSILTITTFHNSTQQPANITQHGRIYRPFITTNPSRFVIVHNTTQFYATADPTMESSPTTTTIFTSVEPFTTHKHYHQPQRSNSSKQSNSSKHHI